MFQTAALPSFKGSYPQAHPYPYRLRQGLKQLHPQRNVACRVSLLLKEKDALLNLVQKQYETFLAFTELPIAEQITDFEGCPEMTRVDDLLKWNNLRELPMINIGNGQMAVMVEDECQIQGAMDMLIDSMTDSLVVLDFEWRSDNIWDNKKADHPISLVNVATDQMCLLFRINKLNNQFPPQLLDFLQNRKLTIGLANRYESDGKKLQSSFNMTFEQLLGQNQERCMDVALLLMGMGYKGTSHRKFAEKILGFPRKINNVKRGDWEAFEFSKIQIFQSALDVFIMGYILRQWHRQYRSRETCPTCGKQYGIRLLFDEQLRCSQCGKEYTLIQSVYEHCLSKGHQAPLDMDNPVCKTCGRFNVKNYQNLEEIVQNGVSQSNGEVLENGVVV